MRKLKVTDQIHVSSVQADALRPGQEIIVTKSHAQELLKRNPSAFADLGDAEHPVVEADAGEKASPDPENKAAPAHADKAAKAAPRKQGRLRRDLRRQRGE